MDAYRIRFRTYVQKITTRMAVVVYSLNESNNV